MTTFVIAQDGTKLMPTTNVKKVRRLLKEKRAIIYKYDPFTIQLTYETGTATQPLEFKEDTGYGNIGVSVVSEKHEYVSLEARTLTDEVAHHNDLRKYKRARRNRKRYRKPRFNNRKKHEGWLAPSIRNKKDLHAQLYLKYAEIAPITIVTLEIGQFDTQVLAAVEAGLPLPEGVDYQHGPTYGYDTLREAVFYRDDYTCLCCEKSAIKDNLILRIHHLGFKTGDRSNRMSNLATVYTKCHTAKNHKPGGDLYEFKPKLKSFRGAAFMNTVKYQLYNDFKEICGDVPVHITYGAVTKRTRLNRNLPKSHANDAYCIGEFHPKHRAHTVIIQKRRRNNRVLEKFYDAKYIDTRDNTVKKGAQLSCGRTNRSESRNSEKNERIYRGKKQSDGRRTIRRQHYSLRPGDVVVYNGNQYTVVGIQNEGAYVRLKDLKSPVKTKDVKPVYHVGGWMMVS